MALTTIAYGSIASSEVINNNFNYVDGRITSSNESLSSSISSLLSNIATINSRITEISEDFNSAVSTLSAAIEEYRTKTKLLVKNSSMVPNWSACASINFTSGTNYTASSNGFVLVVTGSSFEGNIKINGNTVNVSVNDTCPILFPVKSGDVLTTTIANNTAWFIPATEISVENF